MISAGCLRNIGDKKDKDGKRSIIGLPDIIVQKKYEIHKFETQCKKEILPIESISGLPIYMYRCINLNDLFDVFKSFPPIFHKCIKYITVSLLFQVMISLYITFMSKIDLNLNHGLHSSLKLKACVHYQLAEPHST